MKKPIKPKNESDQPIFEPFPEPRTMPEGWDLSGLLPDPNSDSVAQAENFSAN